MTEKTSSSRPAEARQTMDGRLRELAKVVGAISSLADSVVAAMEAGGDDPAVVDTAVQAVRRIGYLSDLGCRSVGELQTRGDAAAWFGPF